MNRMNRQYLLAFFILVILCSSSYVFGQNNTLQTNKSDTKQVVPDKEKDTSEIVKDWLIPLSTFATLITVSIGTALSLKEYRLKLKAEARLADSTAVEMDIKLMQGFTQLLALAHARKGSYLSEKTVEKMFDNNLFTKEELANTDLLSRKIEKVAVLNIFSGIAEQDAFIAAITNLGLKHEILTIPTMQALDTMQEFKPELAKKYLTILEQAVAKRS